jgi:hypothetical protein
MHIMPVNTQDVTLNPLMDLVHGSLAVQFPSSGAYLRIDPTGQVEPGITDILPTADEIVKAARILRSADDVVRAAGLTQWWAAQ